MNKTLQKIVTSALVMAMMATPMVAFAEGADTSPHVSSSASTSSSSSSSTSMVFPYSSVKTAINSYNAQNKDVKSWLYVPGTNINDPVVLQPNSNEPNTYYADRDWTGKEYPNNNYKNYANTALYLDFRTKLGKTWNSSSKNIVVYGHNWDNLRANTITNMASYGANSNYIMFAQLQGYHNQTFAQQNPYIYFSTADMEGVWKVFSVAYVENKTSFPYNTPDPNSTEYATLLNELKARSMYDFSTDVKTSDRIITLSTCTRYYDGVGDGQRFIVVARLLRPGESEKDPVTVTVNSDMKKPQF